MITKAEIKALLLVQTNKIINIFNIQLLNKHPSINKYSTVVRSNMLFLLVASALLLAFFLYRKKSKYWEKRGVPGPTPLPLIGNLGANIIGKKCTPEIYADIYQKYEDYPFVGVFTMGNPCLLIRDPEIIKKITVKDFSYFPNNEIAVHKDLDPLIGLNPFVLKNEEWKKTRQMLTPGFAPAKIKTIFPVAESVSRNLTSYLERHQGIPLNAKEIFGKYTCDIVALYGFGMEGNSFADPNAEFLQIVRKFVTPDSLQAIKLTISFFMPRLLKVKVTPKSFDDALISITKQTLKYRQENNIKRNDYFEAMNQLLHGSIVEVAAHLSGLILDGYETTSVALTLIFYELAQNPDCQQKLRDEINDVLEKHNGQFSYEALKDMTYLDACISEALRMHPPLAQLSKTCTKSYTISSTNSEFKDLSVTLESGSVVIIPLLGLHRDPRYFPSPEKYMPERFLDKSDSFKQAYMPFGNGPRSCLGGRLGLMQSQVATAAVIRDFEISLDEKTRQPLKYDPLFFGLYPKGGVWIRCRKIS